MNNHSTEKFYRTHYGERLPDELDQLCAYHSNPNPDLTGPTLDQNTVGFGSRHLEPTTDGNDWTVGASLSDESDSDSWYETLFT